MKFYIVDAFTETVFGGNPAGVVIIPDGADFPDDETMRKTAAELRYSETAFIKKLNDKEFNIRYFTPAAEVDLCGHATIGSFVALADAGLVKAGEHYTNHTLAGTIGIDVGEGSVLMDMAVPQYINEIATAEGQKELYEIMGLSAEGQGEVEGQYLIPEMISTGLPDIMMPVKNEEELAKIAPDFPALAKLSERYEVVGVHAFTVNTEDGAVHCRNFAPLYDIDEEAATGTSNGALTYYGYLNGFIKDGDDCRFVQGEAMNRPSVSLSHLDVDCSAGGCEDDAPKPCFVKVGGTGVILAEGEIHI
jgi:PhzF family phenazine biosynthesis protein